MYMEAANQAVVLLTIIISFPCDCSMKLVICRGCTHLHKNLFQFCFGLHKKQGLILPDNDKIYQFCTSIVVDLLS